MTDRELLRHIERSESARAGYKQLVREFGLGGGRERRLLLEHLARLTASGQLVKVDRERWAIARAAAARENLVAGRLDLHRDGFGFVRVVAERRGPGESGAARGGPDPVGDVFIPPTELSGAMQGDQVLVELAPLKADGRGSGRIVRVLTRRNPTIVGTFHYAEPDRQMGHQVVPFDERMTRPVQIPFDSELPEPVAAASAHRVLGERAEERFASLEGLIVDVEVTDWPTEHRPARGRVVEVLGHPDGFGVDVEMVIRKHHLPRIFPDAVLAEAEAAASPGEEDLRGRRDFRESPIVTIDGETARDFDDAVLVRERPDGGWELEVHIADVAEYVRPGTALDLEARLRGNSVYFPDRAIPMLPHALSSGICSLRPEQDRLVVSCLMELDALGRVERYKLVEGVIRSARRMTYTQVAAVLDQDEGARREFADLAPEFDRMQRLAQRMYARREERGSIDFDLPEAIIEFDEFGAMKAVTRSTRNWAHRLIEEFMLAANECVAAWLEEHAASIYRVHEVPDPRRILEFEEIAASFGYSLGIGNLPVKRFAMKADRREALRRNERGGRGSTRTRAIEIPEEIPVTPKMYQKLAARIAGKPEERILSYLMLRSLKQARYSEENEGHFALAAASYTHFTSPIRRYPDLIVHRLVKALLRSGVAGEGTKPEETRRNVPRGTFREVDGLVAETELAAIARESSENERRAAAAERELVEWKKIRFMRDRVGDEFDGLILSATKYGLFVELAEFFVEGLVPIGSLGALDGDFYTYRESTREIIGEHWGRKFGMGSPVRVRLDRVDAVEKRLQFSIVLGKEEQDAPSQFPKLGEKKAAKPKKEKKRKSMQASSPKSRIPAPKHKKPKRK